MKQIKLQARYGKIVYDYLNCIVIVFKFDILRFEDSTISNIKNPSCVSHKGEKTLFLGCLSCSPQIPHLLNIPVFFIIIVDSLSIFSKSSISRFKLYYKAIIVKIGCYWNKNINNKN